MNKVTGKMTLANTDAGIPNLLVVIYDVDPDTKPEEIVAVLSNVVTKNKEEKITSKTKTNSRSNDLGFIGDRLGSVLTDSDGSFNITYQDEDLRARNEKEKRPDLLLIAFAPETTEKRLQERLLFVSPDIRFNAGKTETYLVQIPKVTLEKAGLPIPKPNIAQDEDDRTDDLAKLEKKLIADKDFTQKKRAILQKHINEDRKKYESERQAKFSIPFREGISKVPKAFRDSSFFVRDEESVAEKSLTLVKTEIKNRFNNPPRPEKKPVSGGFIYLTEQQIKNYQQFLQGDEYVLPADIVKEDILPALFKANGENGSANDFLMNHPTVKLCIEDIKDTLVCKPHQEDVPDPEQPDPVETIPLPPAKGEDVALYIAKQMENVTAPEGVLNFGVESKDRASAGEIADNIGSLQFGKGPADIPAFFDFHTLNIAFPHVWKEAIDQGILQNAEEIYNELVNSGIDPTDNATSSLVRSGQTPPVVIPPTNQGDGFTLEVPKLSVNVVFEFPEASAIWKDCTNDERTVLEKLALAILYSYTFIGNPWIDYLNNPNGGIPKFPYILFDPQNVHFTQTIAYFRQKGEAVIKSVQERIEEKQEIDSDFSSYKNASTLAEELNKRLKENYSFTYFAADKIERSVNFGIMITYRQKWEPVNYQAGELVKTISLAPKEVRKYNKKTVVKKSRTEKAIEETQDITKSDSSDTNRAESEIIRKASNKTSFSTSRSMNADMPIGETAKIGSSEQTDLAAEASIDSSNTKKDFRENVIKAAQEYKNERKTEITTEASYEEEITESGEITNPNDELTVTYLFYELQRQFKINERLHRLRPVVLVAQEMPAPNEIDDDWLVSYDWILKRVLLDDSFRYTFDCVMEIRGERLLLAELTRTVKEQRQVVHDLRQNVKYFTDQTGRMTRLMQAAVNKEADVAEDRDIWDGIPLLGDALDAAEGAIKGVGKLIGMGSGDDPGEAARIRREGVKDSYERADRERRELMGRLEHELGVLNGMTRQVAEKRKSINEKEVLIVRLKNHIKDNILYYMQAIWKHEHPDQRFFRLFKTKVPSLSARPDQYNLKIKKAPVPSAIYDEVVNAGRKTGERKVRHQYTCSPEIEIEEKDLIEVADLDNLLGFKGNYMIFPLRKSNVLTDFMMAPYVDSEFGLLDPHAAGNWTLEEFEQLYCCLQKEMGERFSEIEEELKIFYRQLLTDPLRPDELITVPTGSLFIEALPGAHPLLENFKMLHRAVDVKKVQAEVRAMELENIRYAARLLADEREDPRIEKKIVVEGNGVSTNLDIGNG